MSKAGLSPDIPQSARKFVAGAVSKGTGGRLWALTMLRVGHASRGRYSCPAFLKRTMCSENSALRCRSNDPTKALRKGRGCLLSGGRKPAIVGARHALPLRTLHHRRGMGRARIHNRFRDRSTRRLSPSGSGASSPSLRVSKTYVVPFFRRRQHNKPSTLEDGSVGLTEVHDIALDAQRLERFLGPGSPHRYRRARPEVRRSPDARGPISRHYKVPCFVNSRRSPRVPATPCSLMVRARRPRPEPPLRR